MVNWSEMWKIRLNNYSDGFLTHEIVKLVVVKSILNKNHKDKQYQEIYTEYPIGFGKIVDVYWKNHKTKETYYFEIQKNVSKKWLKDVQNTYKKIDGDLIIIPLKKMSDSILELNNQVKDYIP